MARPIQQFQWTYDDLVKLTGLERKTVWKHHDRGHFDPERIETVGLYLAKYGLPELRVRFMAEVLRQTHESEPGVAKNARAAKSPSKRKPQI